MGKAAQPIPVARLAAEAQARAAVEPQVEASAAAEIFAALLPSAVTGRRTALSDGVMLGDMDRDGPSMNSRVLPPSFEVIDAPAYSLDDEGVPAQVVKVVEKGLLKRLLTSRTPVKGGLESNGHGRATPGGPAMAAVTSTISTNSPAAARRSRIARSW